MEQDRRKKLPLHELFGLVGLIFVIAGVGFLYRYETEQPKAELSAAQALHNPTQAGNAQACTQEAKVCPDGSAVGRTGPNCSFAICAPPNIEISLASSTLSFILPSGYRADPVSASDPSVRASYHFDSGAISHTISIHSYDIAATQTASQVLLAHTTFDPSGLQATSTAAFKSITLGQHTFYDILIERFEGQVQSAYYLYEPHDVIRFDVTERGVQNWSSPALVPSQLPQHQALQQMLATLQVVTN